MVNRRPRTTDRWLPGLPPSPEARVQLFCFSHAGGGASTFREWGALMPPAVAVRPVQYPGREQRFNETPIASVDELTAALLGALRPHLERPFAFFGHSLGGLLSYELTQALVAEGGPLPVQLFISGARAPHSALPNDPLYDLPDDELLLRLAKMGGTPARVLQEQELMKLFLPVLRADFTMADTYQRPADAPLLAVPVTVFEGTEDGEVDADKLAAWKQRVRGRYLHVRLPGDHFFLHSARDRLLEVVGRQLLAALG